MAVCTSSRLGSGSAPRSLYRGFVEMSRGQRSDGLDAVARPLFPAEHWPLEVLIAIVSDAAKPVGSSAGMDRSAESSPFFASWVEHSAADLAEARAALAREREANALLARERDEAEILAGHDDHRVDRAHA